MGHLLARGSGCWGSAIRNWAASQAIIRAKCCHDPVARHFIEFPPRRKAASFTLDQAVTKLKAALTKAGNRSPHSFTPVGGSGRT